MAEPEDPSGSNPFRELFHTAEHEENKRLVAELEEGSTSSRPSVRPRTQQSRPWLDPVGTADTPLSLKGYFHELASSSVFGHQAPKADPLGSTVAVLPSLPWYESTLLWGAGGIAVTIVLAVVAAMMHDLRWLLAVALPFWCVAMWAATAPIKRRRITTAVLSLLGAMLLYWLSVGLKPEAIVATTAAPKSVQLPVATLQSRVNVVDVKPHMVDPRVSWPVLTFFYANQGSVTAHGITRSTMISVTNPVEMSADEIRKSQRDVDVFEDYSQASKATEMQELYPNDAQLHFWSTPDRPGNDAQALKKQLPNLLSGKKWLYVFVNMKWKDKAMGPDVIGVSESCFYFPGSFENWHECGSRRSFLRTQQKEVTP